MREIEAQTQEPNFWSDQDRATAVLRERTMLQGWVDGSNTIAKLYQDATAALELAIEEKDEDFLSEASQLYAELEGELQSQEFFCMMRGEFDANNAIVEINGGSGGTEAQDWAEMLLRTYLRWAERKGFSAEELDYNPGEEAGLKSVTLLISGSYAYGYLRSEQGVHRLVRISPFDSNARRHTSFASVSVTPDIEEDIAIEIDEKDLRIDTYRSSGAGGQHVNKTDSAVRITHIPTGIVVACQNERSQHKNRDRAMKTLKAKLYELRMREQSEKMDQIKGERKAIDFGSQIRSYVMQPYQMVKDLRTGYETSDVQSVLDGDIDSFIESFLMGSAKQNT